MALMSDSNRAAAWAEYMRELSDEREAVGALTKQELRTALNDIDQWVSDNAAAFNTAISQPARGVLTSAQKARLLMFVVRKRFLTGT